MLVHRAGLLSGDDSLYVFATQPVGAAESIVQTQLMVRGPRDLHPSHRSDRANDESEPAASVATSVWGSGVQAGVNPLVRVASG
jgi:hypothetical protein